MPDSGPEPKCLRLGRTPDNQGGLPAGDFAALASLHTGPHAPIGKK